MNFLIYKPEVFQGSLRKKNYFEGWYYKHVTAGLDHVYSFIPGVSLNNNDPHAFIQVLNGITGASFYLKYDLSDFSFRRDRLYLKIAGSIFTDGYCDLDIDDDGLKIRGQVLYLNTARYPKSIFTPGIMGWYSFVPFMECKHGIVSANHDLMGKLKINGDPIIFNKGKGYIEKDWGTSFPEAWLWIQANNFSDNGTSFCFSVAKIPWRGKFFIGFIAFLYHANKFFLFCTYNNSEIKKISHTDGSVFLSLSNGRYNLEVNTSRSFSGELMAPVSGEMSRRIKESIDSVVSITLSDSAGKIICSDTSRRAGVEVIEKIFDYLK